MDLMTTLGPFYGKSVITVSVITVRNSVITVRNSDGVRQSGFTAVRSVITVRNSATEEPVSAVCYVEYLPYT
jgi:phosphoribosylaminoimidazole (AIR) synthetase